MPANEPDDTAEMLGHLLERAPDAAGAQRRLQELFEANQAIVGDLELPVVLRRIVEAACRLVDARYGALGVLGPGGRHLEQFLTVGVDDATTTAIGHLPTGKGLLGALIDDPVPIRLERMADDPRSAGFPAHHPAMVGFLGVPIRVRSEVFGNLYLADAAAGRFSDEDERLVTALAATAGIAIDNARLFTQSQQRQQWLEASSVITRQLLAVDGEDPLTLIACRAREIADADIVTVVLPSVDPDALLVEVAAGVSSVEQLAGYTYRRGGSLVDTVLNTGRPALVADAEDGSIPWHQSEAMPVGAVMALPLAGATEPRGVLAIGRAQGRRPFDDADLEMAGAFANQAALALELADARADQSRVEVLEDRDRIARDLHDHVIQQLFAVGLSAQGMAARERDPGLRERLSSMTTAVDATIAQIRTSVFALRGGDTASGASTRRQVLDLVAQVTPTLRCTPGVRFDGPVDTVVAGGALEDLLATLREALTNVARHADATRVDVTVTAEHGRATLTVVDDGIGIGPTTRRSGLANLRSRAERRGGTLHLGTADVHVGREGTRLTWSIQL